LGSSRPVASGWQYPGHPSPSAFPKSAVLTQQDLRVPGTASTTTA